MKRRRRVWSANFATADKFCEKSGIIADFSQNLCSIGVEADPVSRYHSPFLSVELGEHRRVEQLLFAPSSQRRPGCSPLVARARAQVTRSRWRPIAASLEFLVELSLLDQGPRQAHSA